MKPEVLAGNLVFPVRSLAKEAGYSPFHPDDVAELVGEFQTNNYPGMIVFRGPVSEKVRSFCARVIL